MRHLMGPMLAATCVCGCLVLCMGCREDLIDATPVNDAVVEPEVPVTDAPMDAPEEGEQTVAGSEGDAPAEPSEGLKPAGDAPAEPPSQPRRRTGGDTPQSSGGNGQSGGGGSTPAQPAERPAERSGQPPARAGGSERPEGARREGGAGLFERHDADGDGRLSRSELPEEIRDRLMAADADGDGALTPEELRAARPRRGSDGGDLSPEERRARMMERMDANGDGKITLDELPERLREAMKEADTNGDGVLSAEELDRAREAMGERWRDRPGGRRGGPGSGPRDND